MRLVLAPTKCLTITWDILLEAENCHFPNLTLIAFKSDGYFTLYILPPWKKKQLFFHTTYQKKTKKHLYISHNHFKLVLVLLSASVERLGVSPMRDFLVKLYFFQRKWKNPPTIPLHGS